MDSIDIIGIMMMIIIIMIIIIIVEKASGCRNLIKYSRLHIPFQYCTSLVLHTSLNVCILVWLHVYTFLLLHFHTSL